MRDQFGRLLKEYRKGAELSQKQLLERIRQARHEERYSEADISKWEHGRTKPPEDVIEDLEDILFVPKGLLLRAAGYSAATEYQKLQDQSPANLPPWVVQAQQAHLEGIERQEVWKGAETITYRQPGIRQLLQGFKDCFLDTYPEKELLWRPKYDESVMAQLRSHLPDRGFWNKVRDFKGKATESETLLNAAYQSFTSAGEEVAPLRADDCPDSHITSSWARQVVFQALAPLLGLVSWGYALGETELSCGKLIYRGPDVSNAVEKHRRLVGDFRKTQEFSLIADLMKDLQNLRQQIFARVNQCLHDNEYALHYCPSCPAEKARRSQLLL
jgi:transcriptional regulator with XRE-family HTH domain